MLDLGLDLAWGSRAVTGAAALDERGHLLDVTVLRTDAEILDWAGGLIGQHAPCLVAIDAPIVVRNVSGSRECERLVGRHFGRFHASCYPSNTTNPAFADGGRALRLVTALGLDVSLGSTAPRRAVEVYPHAALVSLFDLPSVLQYKSRPGRDLEHRRRELLRLLDLLESLETAPVPLVVQRSQRWRSLREAVEVATLKAHLGRVEDAVDAVVCAYVARYARTCPEGVRALGTSTEGYILTPVTASIAVEIDAG